MSRKSFLVFVGRLVGLAIMLIAVDQLVDWELVLDQVFSVPISLLAVCVLLALVRVWISGVRWRLLNPDPGAEISSWGYFRYMMISATFNLFLPGALGGDIARSFMLYRTDSPARVTHILSIAADRYVGLVSILAVGLVAILFLPADSGRAEYVTIILAVLAVVVCGGWIVTSEFLPKLMRRALADEGRAQRFIVNLRNRLLSVMDFYRHEKGRVAGAFALCLPIHLITFAILYAFAVSGEIRISFLALSAACSIVWVVAAIPISISGLGLRELSFVYLLSLQGISAEAATALSLQHFGINVLIGVLGAPLLYFSPPPPATMGSGSRTGTRGS